VNILIKKDKHIRTYKYTTEQTMVAYEEAAKRANLDGA
jgi:hypothetical protein